MRLGTYAIIILISVLFCGTASAADLGLRFTGNLPDRVGVADSVRFSWVKPGPGVEMRYGLKLPGLIYGSQPDWSKWGHANNVVYSGFVADGKYTLKVEARNPSGEIQKISHSFYVDFVPPAVFKEGVKIDRKKILQARSRKEKYEIAASEFKKAYHVWSEVYEKRRRKLKDSYNVEELVDLFDEVTITELCPRLIEKYIDTGVGQTVGKVLFPKLIYDITKRAGKTAVLSVLNFQTNAAALRTVYSYKLWKSAEKMAQEAGGIAENNHPDGSVSSSAGLPISITDQLRSPSGMVQGEGDNPDVPGENYLVLFHNESLHLIRTVPEGQEEVDYGVDFDLVMGDNLFRVFLLDRYLPGAPLSQNLTTKNILAASDPQSYHANLETLDLMATLSWHTDRTDVDLHLVPQGMVNFAKKGSDCFYGSKKPRWGDSVNNPELDIDDRNGFGPENIIVKTLRDGIYFVVIEYFAANGVGPTDCNLTLRLQDGKPIPVGPLRLNRSKDRVVAVKIKAENGRVTLLPSN